jgi:hypothetical protein
VDSVHSNHVSFAVRTARPQPIEEHVTVAHDWKVEDRVRLNATFKKTREGKVTQIIGDGWLCVQWDVEGPSAVHPSNIVRI